MPIPNSKAELIRAIEADSAKLIAAFNAMDAKLWDNAILQGNIQGTTITPANLLAYQIGWGRLVLSWYQKGLEGVSFEMPLEGFKWNELGKLATYFHKEYESHSPSELQEMFQALVKEILNLVFSLTNEELYTVGVFKWTGKYTLGRYIQINTSSPYKNAIVKLRVVKKL
jgi:hypothetical protein